MQNDTHLYHVMHIIGIETSCDDTGVAVVDGRPDGTVSILSNCITPQDHNATGGVVPNIAAQHHAAAIIPTLELALKEVHCQISNIDCIAVTVGPGLMPCLCVGVTFAKKLSAAHNIPIIGVNHMEGHIASTFATHPHVNFPAVVLLASGGHTMLVNMERVGSYDLIGETRDDAAGEAFDKVARMLGLPYPGGAPLARLAEHGDPHAIVFPRPMLHDDNFDFSFSGLKTSVLYHIRDHEPLLENDRANIAAGFQEAVVDVLVRKTIAAAREYVAQTIIFGGGVSANRALQKRLRETAAQELPETHVIIPSPGLFTDNGAMIAIAAAPRALRGDFDDACNIIANPNLRLL